jgi:transposase
MRGLETIAARASRHVVGPAKAGVRCLAQKSRLNTDREAYKRRNLIERCVSAIEQFRRIAARYEKELFFQGLCIGAARLWIKTVNTA